MNGGRRIRKGGGKVGKSDWGLARCSGGVGCSSRRRGSRATQGASSVGDAEGGRRVKVGRQSCLNILYSGALKGGSTSRRGWSYS